MNGDLVFNIETISNDSIRFYTLIDDFIVGDITISSESTTNSNFDVDFLLKEPLLSLSELSTQDIEKLKMAENIEEKIEIYKKTHYYIRPLFKILIFTAEYAFQVYKRETLSPRPLNLVIEDCVTSMNIPIQGIMFTFINSIWHLLDFEPKQSIELFKTKDWYEINLPHSVKTRYVLRDMNLNERDTDHFITIDDERYEKGRNYQWGI
ncbi:MAG: hypothetical protein AAF901_13860 [Bacteroidota bacterium]